MRAILPFLLIGVVACSAAAASRLPAFKVERWPEFEFGKRADVRPLKKGLTLHF